MFGGTNFQKSQFNLATQAERQPGSAFKPIVLATAMRQGVSPVTTFPSQPVTIDAGDRFWRVTNYEDTYLGRVSLDRAMVSSDNSVYAQLTQFVRPAKIVEAAHDLGVRTDLPAYFSLGLGRGGGQPTRHGPRLLHHRKRWESHRRIAARRPPARCRAREFERSGRTRENQALPREVLAPGAAATLTAILQDVVRSGTGKRAAVPGLSVAGKTGTTDNYGDAWFVGYTPDLVVAVWVGYPDALRPMLTEFGGEPVTGGTLPARSGRSSWSVRAATASVAQRLVRR